MLLLFCKFTIFFPQKGGKNILFIKFASKSPIGMQKEHTHDLLAKFAYCPVCGSPRFATRDFKSKRCPDCGFEFYLNSAGSVVCILLDGAGNILVSRRAFEPQKGTLDFPGGFVDADESLEQAVRREMREETGLDVNPLRWLFSLPNRYLYSGLVIPTVDNFFLCQASRDAAAKPHDDVAELLWLPLATLQPQQFGLASMRTAIPKLQALFTEK